MTIRLAWRNLLYQKGKLILGPLGVGASLTLIILLTGFRDGLYSAVTAYTDHMDADLMVTQSGGQGGLSASAIPAAIHDELAATAGALETEHVLSADIIFTHGDVKWPSILVGYNLDSGWGGPWEMGAGRDVRADDEITLDTWLARKTDIQIGDAVDVLGRRFTVVGLTRGTASWMGTYLFVSRAAAEDLLEMPGMASFFLLRLPEGADRQAISETIQSRIPGVGVVAPEEQARASKEVLKTALSTPLNVMLFISIITGIAVMGLTTYTAIMDRVREYGVLKALGANGRWLRRLVMAETLYRAGLGFVLGIGLSYLAADLIMRVFPQFTIVIGPRTILWTGLMALVMSIFAALLPLRRVTAIDPAMVFKA